MLAIEEVDQVDPTGEALAGRDELGIQVAELVPVRRPAPDGLAQQRLYRAEPGGELVVVVRGRMLLRLEAQRIEVSDETRISAVSTPVTVERVLQAHTDRTFSGPPHRGFPPRIPRR